MKLSASVLLLITLIPTAFSHKMQFVQFTLGTVQNNVRNYKNNFLESCAEAESDFHLCSQVF